MTSHSGTRRGLVVGCGGTLGFAWTAQVLDALDRSGWDPRTADVLVGTSAGSEAVALLGSGVSAASILASVPGRHDPGRFPPLPRLRLTSPGLRGDLAAVVAGVLPRGGGDAGWLMETYGEGWVPHPATWVVAADRRGRRVAFGRSDAPTVSIGRAVAASWAIPGWFPPVTIAGQPYVDGGAVSPTSADLLVGQGLDEVVVIAPMSGNAPATGLSRLERVLRRRMTAVVDREISALEAGGVVVRRIEPSAEHLAVMGPNFMDARRVDHVLRTKVTVPGPSLLGPGPDGEVEEDRRGPSLLGTRDPSRNRRNPS